MCLLTYGGHSADFGLLIAASLSISQLTRSVNVSYAESVFGKTSSATALAATDSSDSDLSVSSSKESES